MTNGKWYLRFVYFGFESMGNEVQEGRRELAATDEASALIEARELWSALQARNQYKSPGGTTYPHSPRLSYEVDL